MRCCRTIYCQILALVAVSVALLSVYMSLFIILSKLPPLIEECFQQVIDTGAAIHNPSEQAFFTMVHLSYLHPFEDINKRVSRLAANIPFIRENLSPLSFIDVPERAYVEGLLGVYELSRVELLRDFCVGVRAISQTLCGSATIAGRT
jgi:hypothetical protein